MNPNFRPSMPPNSDNQPYSSLDSQLKRDRYELLSAYIDSELSARDRKRVEHWLQTDDQMKSLYDRLLKLRIGMQALPVPESSVSVEETVAAVCRRVDQRKRRRTFVLAGAAIASLFFALVSGNSNLTLQHATNSVDEGLELSVDGLDVSLDKSLIEGSDTAGKALSGSALMIAIDEPVIEIPDPTTQLVQPPVDGAVRASEDSADPTSAEEGTL